MHRDLKSANIFLIKDKNQCKIGDMNVSKVIKEKLLRTQTGTPYYASPEVWMDKPYSFKSDLWSIGCIIYELCELKTPFSGENIDDLFINVCRGKIERINKVYSDDLWKMINMLLQVDVEKRVDCDKFLNCELLRKKIDEMKKNENLENPDFCNQGNIFLSCDKGGELLDTIKLDDIKDIKSILPNKKNYDSSTAESFIKNLSNFSHDKNFSNDKNINNDMNYNITDKDKKGNEKENGNENKLLFKEIRKELEYMKLKEEMRKKEKKENLEKKLKNEKNNKEKNIIKEKIKLSENKLKSENNKKNLELNLKNFKLKNNKNRNIIPFNFNKKIKFIKRNQIKNLFNNNSISKLSLITNPNANSIKINDIDNYFTKNQSSVRYNQDIRDKYLELKLNLNSPSSVKKINKKSQSFSHLKIFQNNSNISFKIISKPHATLSINTNNGNINDKSNPYINEKEMAKTNILNYITSINSDDNDNNYNNQFKYSSNSISNLKKNYNFDFKKDNTKYYYSYNKGVKSTPDLGQLATLTKIPRKKTIRKTDIKINFNFIPNNYINNLNNNRYPAENMPNLINNNKNMISGFNSTKNNTIKVSSSFKNYFPFPKKTKNIFDKIDIGNKSNYYSNKNTYHNLQINIPIKSGIQRKLTEINIEKKINQFKNELNRNKFNSLEKYELENPGAINYDIKNNVKRNIKDNILTKKNNIYMKRYNNIGMRNEKQSFLRAVKKESINKLLSEIKSNRTNNKYYNYHVQKYPATKIKSSSNSFKMFNGNSCLNIPIKTKQFLHN